MFTYILWGLIVVALIIAAKRIFEGAILLVIYILLIFFAVFLLDTITPFPLRSIITLDWYDEAVEDPGQAIKETVDKATETGEKAVGKVNEAGSNLDVHYGTEYDKEWKDVTDENEKGVVEDIAGEGAVGSERKSTTIGGKLHNNGNVKKKDTLDGDEDKVAVDGEIFIKYTDVGKEITGELSGLPEGDKEIMAAMTSVYKTRLQGEKIEVWNTGDNYEEGFYLAYKGE